MSRGYGLKFDRTSLQYVVICSVTNAALNYIARYPLLGFDQVRHKSASKVTILDILDKHIKDRQRTRNEGAVQPVR